jgi:hypothetical protein
LSTLRGSAGRGHCRWLGGFHWCFGTGGCAAFKVLARSLAREQSHDFDQRCGRDWRVRVGRPLLESLGRLVPVSGYSLLGIVLGHTLAPESPDVAPKKKTRHRAKPSKGFNTMRRVYLHFARSP